MQKLAGNNGFTFDDFFENLVRGDNSLLQRYRLPIRSDMRTHKTVGDFFFSVVHPQIKTKSIDYQNELYRTVAIRAKETRGGQENEGSVGNYG